MIHILGAGIAGLTLAAALDRRGKPWRLYEKASETGAEASGKNAGIIRTYETDPVMRRFAALSLGYYRHEEPSYVERGILLRPWEVDYDQPAPQKRPFSHRRFDGFFLPENGTIEPRGLLQRIAATPFGHGTLEFNFDAVVRSDGQRIEGLASLSGREIVFAEGDVLVAACGEGTIALAKDLDRPLALIAHRRTLYEFHNTTNYDGPVEWNEECGVYFRPLGDTLLATAGEQIPSAPDAALEEGGDAKMLAILEREFPFMSYDRLTGTRTCKRLTPLDNRPYAGRDAHFANLFWFTGLGGRGISTAPAFAEALADCLGGKDTGQLAAVSPARVHA